MFNFKDKSLPYSSIVINLGFIVLGAFFFSVCILYSSDNIVLFVLIAALLLGIISVWLPVIIPASFIIATIIIPDEILPFLSGTNVLYGFGFLKLHPASIILFVGSVLNIIFRRKILYEQIHSSKMLFSSLILFGIFAISIFIQTFPLGGFKGMPQCLENYIFPFFFFLYLLTLNKQSILKILKIYIISIILISIYGLIEYLFRTNFLYGALYSKAAYNMQFEKFAGYYRITTTMGHPLKNALYFIFCIPISVFILKRPFNFISVLILELAIFTTGSRMALFLSIVIIMACYMSIRFNIFEYYKNILITSVIILILYGMLYYSILGKTVIGRFYDSRDSIEVRFHFLKIFPTLIANNFFRGKGMGLSFDLSTFLLGERRIGFENPWIMLVADVGFITTSLYLVIMLLTLMAKIRYLKYKDINRGIYLSLFFSLLMASSFNSFGSRNAINFLIWFNVALLYVLSPQQNIEKTNNL